LVVAELGMVAFNLLIGDDAVGGLQVGEHVVAAQISESKIRVL
jgi:hypothetical protein